MQHSPICVPQLKVEKLEPKEDSVILTLTELGKYILKEVQRENSVERSFPHISEEVFVFLLFIFYVFLSIVFLSFFFHRCRWLFHVVTILLLSFESLLVFHWLYYEWCVSFINFDFLTNIFFEGTSPLSKELKTWRNNLPLRFSWGALSLFFLILFILLF